MSIISSLKITGQRREALVISPEQHLRNRLIAGINEQITIAKADIAGQPIVLTRKRQVTDPETKIRTEVEQAKRMRRWYWHNSGGVWFMELRYGNRVLVLDAKTKNTSIEIGSKDRLISTLESLIIATQNGELDVALKAMLSNRKKAK